MTCICTETISVSKIKLNDPRSRKATFLNPKNENFEKCRVDNCLIKGKIASDWVLTKPAEADIIIELKGKDVDHAVAQVLATAQFWHESKRATKKMAALIVCNEYPRTTTKIQRAKSTMMKKFRAPLHIYTGDREYSFDKILSF